MTEEITVLLADDHKIIRDGLRSLLAAHENIRVVGEAGHGREAVDLVKKLKPRVVVMDVGMPELNGVDAAQQILAVDPSIRIVALSMHSDSRFVGRMLQAGTASYLLKDCAAEDLAQAIFAVCDGQTYLSPAIAGIVVDNFVRGTGGQDAEPTDSLTAREREVLQLIAEGAATKQIALRLHVSTKTIESHRKNIMEKLELFSIAELTKFAIRAGLTDLES